MALRFQACNLITGFLHSAPQTCKSLGCANSEMGVDGNDWQAGWRAGCAPIGLPGEPLHTSWGGRARPKDGSIDTYSSRDVLFADKQKVNLQGLRSFVMQLACLLRIRVCCRTLYQKDRILSWAGITSRRYSACFFFCDFRVLLFYSFCRRLRWNREKFRLGWNEIRR